MNDCSIVLLVENLFEDLELWYPKLRLVEAGYPVTVMGTGKKSYTGKQGLAAQEDLPVDAADPADYVAVVIPGGYSPYHMRRHAGLIEFLRHMDAQGKIVAMIGHAARVAAAAGIVQGRRVSADEGLRDDLEAAGARWVDARVVQDENLISARGTSDLPELCRTLLRAIGSCCAVRGADLAQANRANGA